MENIPLQPLSRKDIYMLETALLVSALFDAEVLEKIKNPSDRVTWVDSLAVVDALARKKSGMSITEIAEEIGRSESTIRNHLEGKTEAGRIILKVYEKLVEQGGKLEIRVLEATELEKKVKELKAKLEDLENKLKGVIDTFDEIKKLLG